MNQERFAGGCQCGAVRFSAEGYVDASICHCRMCQKAFGAYYAPLATFETVTWTRGQPARFQSSNIAARGFCRDCGTPLTYEPKGGRVSLAIGALDEPGRAVPTTQFGIEGLVAGVRHLDELSETPTTETGVESRQHPDHDAP
ncbi:MAG TPA: GFA family protein [Caulobacteraceae bacterium]